MIEEEDEDGRRDAEGGNEHDPQVLQRHLVVVLALFHPPEVTDKNIKERVVANGNLLQEVLGHRDPIVSFWQSQNLRKRVLKGRGENRLGELAEVLLEERGHAVRVGLRFFQDPRVTIVKSLLENLERDHTSRLPVDSFFMEPCRVEEVRKTTRIEGKEKTKKKKKP